MGRLKSVLAGVGLATVFAGPAAGDFAADEFPPYERCALCHGLFGVSARDKFPNLAGQKPAYIEAQVRAFLDGQRQNDGGQMAAIVTELLPEDIPVVVAWFSSQDPPEPAEKPTSDSGEMLFESLGCSGCHDNKADGAEDIPFLSAQHAAYLSKQMRDFMAGARSAPQHPGMHKSMLGDVSAEIENIAAYLAAVERPK